MLFHYLKKCIILYNGDSRQLTLRRKATVFNGSPKHFRKHEGLSLSLRSDTTFKILVKKTKQPFFPRNSTRLVTLCSSDYVVSDSKSCRLSGFKFYVSFAPQIDSHILILDDLRWISNLEGNLMIIHEVLLLHYYS